MNRLEGSASPEPQGGRGACERLPGSRAQAPHPATLLLPPQSLFVSLSLPRCADSQIWIPSPSRGRGSLSPLLWDRVYRWGWSPLGLRKSEKPWKIADQPLPCPFDNQVNRDIPTTKILPFFSISAKAFYIQAHQGTSAPDAFCVLRAQLPASSLFSRPQLLPTQLCLRDHRSEGLLSFSILFTLL